MEKGLPVMSWLRLYTDLINDPKVMQLECKLFRTWISCLCIAKQRDGVLPDLPAIAFALRIKEETAKQHVDALIEANLLDVTENGLIPHNWANRQYLSDTSKARTRRYRDRQKTVTVTSQRRHNAVTVTPPDTDTDTDTDKPLPLTPKTDPQPPAILTPDDVGYWVDLIMELYPTPADSRAVYRWVDDNDNRLSAKGRDKFLNFMTEVQIGLEEWKEYWASRGNEFVPDVMKWLHGNGWKKHPPKPKPLLDGPMYDDGRPL